jgi:two-component system, OmpR family, flagellar system response regulator FtcR
MIVFVDDRAVVKAGFVSLFDRVGVPVTALRATDCCAWVDSAPAPDLQAVEAFLLGECSDRRPLSHAIRGRTKAVLIAINDDKSLADTLELLDAGCDDVVRKPVHARELLARIKAIRRRARDEVDFTAVGVLKTYGDGRDPEISGEQLRLPRRERHILEYLVANRDCWVSKTRVFNSVYGVFSSEIGESVIESHVSKLRRRLRGRLGRDPITAQRFVGYRLDSSSLVSADPYQS